MTPLLEDLFYFDFLVAFQESRFAVVLYFIYSMGSAFSLIIERKRMWISCFNCSLYIIVVRKCNLKQRVL